jgi:hypothetical protein
MTERESTSELPKRRLVSYWRTRRGHLWHVFTESTEYTMDGPITSVSSFCGLHEFNLDSRQTDGYMPWTNDLKCPRARCKTCEKVRGGIQP